jgi:hypothetical protein
MYDDKNHETTDPKPNNDEISQTGVPGIAEAFAQSDGDQVGLIANFIRKQPVLTLSLAFGLGLLATSLLTRKRT